MENETNFVYVSVRTVVAHNCKGWNLVFIEIAAFAMMTKLIYSFEFET